MSTAPEGRQRIKAGSVYIDLRQVSAFDDTDAIRQHACGVCQYFYLSAIPARKIYTGQHWQILVYCPRRRATLPEPPLSGLDGSQRQQEAQETYEFAAPLWL